MIQSPTTMSGSDLRRFAAVVLTEVSTTCAMDGTHVPAAAPPSIPVGVTAAQVPVVPSPMSRTANSNGRGVPFMNWKVPSGLMTRPGGGVGGEKSISMTCRGSWTERSRAARNSDERSSGTGYTFTALKP